jgi:hypothetical protein
VSGTERALRLGIARVVSGHANPDLLVVEHLFIMSQGRVEGGDIPRPVILHVLALLVVQDDVRDATRIGRAQFFIQSKNQGFDVCVRRLRLVPVVAHGPSNGLEGVDGLVDLRIVEDGRLPQGQVHDVLVLRVGRGNRGSNVSGLPCVPDDLGVRLGEPVDGDHVELVLPTPLGDPSERERLACEFERDGPRAVRLDLPCRLDIVPSVTQGFSSNDQTVIRGSIETRRHRVQRGRRAEWELNL